MLHINIIVLFSIIIVLHVNICMLHVDKYATLDDLTQT